MCQHQVRVSGSWPGAFRGSLAAGDDCVALYNHDQNSPLGRISNGKLKLTDSRDSLTATIRLNPKVTLIRDMYELAQDQAFKDCSFAFSANAGGEKWTQENDEAGVPTFCAACQARSCLTLVCCLLHQPTDRALPQCKRDRWRIGSARNPSAS